MITVGDGSLTIVAKNQSVMDKVMEKIDFIVGREVVKGGMYKGIVSSIKEYGAFVEFNGGQQGLLHVSELSHEPVTRVSDVLTIGQVVNVMCIGLDVRGNVNLSLKAALSRQGSKSNTIAEPVMPKEKIPEIWETVENMDKEPKSPSDKPKNQSIKTKSKSEKPKNKSDKPKSQSNKTKNQSDKPLSDGKSVSLSSIVIRSAAECDEVEKSTGANVGESLSSIMFEEEEKSTGLKQNSKDEALIDVKKLKIGMQMIATVHQIRAHGLVLDLGGGLRGMYRFENDLKNEFEVGDKVNAKCSSFSSKGIPVMSLVKD